MKVFFGRIWLIYAAFVFVTTWPMIAVAYFFVYRFSRRNRVHNNSFAVTKFWGKWILFFLGIRYQVSGNRDIPQPCVFVSNHQSQLDIPLNFASAIAPFVILSKQEVTKIPVARTTLKRSHVLVDRKDSASRKQSIEELSNHLKAGRNLLLYPEGSRKNQGTLGEFKAGAFLLAIENQVPLVPVVIVGTNRLNNPQQPYSIFPGKVQLIVGEPVSTKGISANQIDELKAKVREAFLEYL